MWVMTRAEPAQRLAASPGSGAGWRRLSAGRPFRWLGAGVPSRLSDWGFHMAQVLVARVDEAADGVGQRDRRWGGRHRQRCEAGPARPATARGGNSGIGHAAKLTDTTPCNKVGCAPERKRRKFPLTTLEAP